MSDRPGLPSREQHIQISTRSGQPVGQPLVRAADLRDLATPLPEPPPVLAQSAEIGEVLALARFLSRLAMDVQQDRLELAGPDTYAPRHGCARAEGGQRVAYEPGAADQVVEADI